ncbi:MAG: tRNA (guanosine(37)-N1)-methyltransferase TrmD [Candidatus Bipolaricaulota bacterium]|nr:tRNA (guanosine(37)-N1)-methyltransferase TrmD [Candidatus Bipolaricaulota bacterium]MCS7274282.1 tRNA (guanosine(37)-N1)-methyltransferase TrmD [Candidatus Bipolaricaulota bacterium]MDW8111467.1 tRNA (guanosine(37)-N1)-methyltransferase TrmD [Candidatus Bipolaricaulota bacterium]MDW8329390.1 tRNA (guanosine(37)-N1)-methyltransferase TrmD [Candidatus Bipolaricaulota bacterium]
MRIDIVTIFPQMLEGFFSLGVIGQARQDGIVQIHLHDLRAFTTDKHRQVDDRPYGGGPGMVLKPEPFFRAVRHIKSQLAVEPRVILLSAQGRLFTQKMARELAQAPALILLCGRYEGVDERVLHICTDEISIGDYVLSGGEVAAAVVAEAVARLVPGVVGRQESLEQDSFSEEGLLGPPQYTRPPEFEGLKVPEVLLTGDHRRIEEFRRRAALEKTLKNRPDLLQKR